MLVVRLMARRNLRRDKTFARLIFCICLQLLSVSAVAKGVENVLFIISRGTPDYTKVVDLVEADLRNGIKEYAFNTVLKDAQTEIDSAIEKANVIVTLGTGATDTVMSREITQPVVASLITESAFVAVAEKYQSSKAGALASRVAVVLLDQPFERSLKLASILLPELKNVGLMLGPFSNANVSIFGKQVKNAGMIPQILSITAKDNPIHKIDPVMKNADVFIPVPDSRLINVTTAKWILQLSYRYRVPVIGFSKNYVDAGALAAVYSSPEDVARQTAEVILDFLVNDHQNNKIHRPKYCTLKFNKNVAWHLDIQIKDEQFYHQRLCRL